LILILSCVFTYTNGFQDGSSVTATSIQSRALTKIQAIILVSTFEFCGAIFGGSAVAHTIRSITNYPIGISLLPVLVSGLLGAILWNYITRILKLPSSSTHALIGGILGAVYAAGHGMKYFVWGKLGLLLDATGIWKVVVSLISSPLIGFVAGFLFYRATVFVLLIARASTKVNRLLKSMQWITTALIAFGHGANDTQKAMGVIVLALGVTASGQEISIPIWVRILTGLAMVTGIIFLVPGIVKKVGGGIYRLRPIHGFVTQSSSATVLLLNSAIGGPVSASQVIASSVMGIGTAERRKGVHWLVAKDMLLAWLFTVPLSGLLALGIHSIILNLFKWPGQ
jgi:PiT family inorganic phosphate transporter